MDGVVPFFFLFCFLLHLPSIWWFFHWAVHDVITFCVFSFLSCLFSYTFLTRQQLSKYVPPISPLWCNLHGQKKKRDEEQSHEGLAKERERFNPCVRFFLVDPNKKRKEMKMFWWWSYCCCGAHGWAQMKRKAAGPNLLDPQISGPPPTHYHPARGSFFPSIFQVRKGKKKRFVSSTLGRMLKLSPKLALSLSRLWLFCENDFFSRCWVIDYAGGSCRLSLFSTENSGRSRLKYLRSLKGRRETSFSSPPLSK